MTDRSRARALARQAMERGEPTAWFDALYREAERGKAVVPWDDRAPNPHLARWLDADRASGRALDVGCGTGDNSAELARRGLAVVAFDVSSAAIESAQRRYGAIADWRVADALALPSEWMRAFDLVVEIYTLQVLPPREGAIAARRIASAVADDGTLLVIARARDPGDPEGAMPWPLLRSELEAIPLPLASLEEILDEEDPPVRRWIATYTR